MSFYFETLLCESTSCYSCYVIVIMLRAKRRRSICQLYSLWWTLIITLSNTLGSTRGAGTCYPSRTSNSKPGLNGVRVAYVIFALLIACFFFRFFFLFFLCHMTFSIDLRLFFISWYNFDYRLRWAIFHSYIHDDNMLTNNKLIRWKAGIVIVQCKSITAVATSGAGIAYSSEAPVLSSSRF